LKAGSPPKGLRRGGIVFEEGAEEGVGGREGRAGSEEGDLGDCGSVFAGVEFKSLAEDGVGFAGGEGRVGLGGRGAGVLGDGETASFGVGALGAALPSSTASLRIWDAISWTPNCDSSEGFGLGGAGVAPASLLASLLILRRSFAFWFWSFFLSAICASVKGCLACAGLGGGAAAAGALSAGFVKPSFAATE